jgi:hypothetical protein
VCTLAHIFTHAHAQRNITVHARIARYSADNLMQLAAALLILERALMDFVKCDTFTSDPVRTHFLHIRDNSTPASDPNIREVTWKRRSRVLPTEGGDGDARGGLPSRRKRYIPQQKSELEWMWACSMRPRARSCDLDHVSALHPEVVSSAFNAVLPYACMSAACPTRSWFEPSCYAPRCTTHGRASPAFASLLDRLLDRAERAAAEQSMMMGGHVAEASGSAQLPPPSMPLATTGFEMPGGATAGGYAAGPTVSEGMMMASSHHQQLSGNATVHHGAVGMESTAYGSPYYDAARMTNSRQASPMPTTPNHSGTGTKRRVCGYCQQPGHYVTSCMYRKEGRPPPELETPPPSSSTPTAHTPRSAGSAVRRSARQPKVAEKFVPSGGPSADSDRHVGVPLLDTVRNAHIVLVDSGLQYTARLSDLPSVACLLASLLELLLINTYSSRFAFSPPPTDHHFHHVSHTRAHAQAPPCSFSFASFAPPRCLQARTFSYTAARRYPHVFSRSKPSSPP